MLGELAFGQLAFRDVEDDAEVMPWFAVGTGLRPAAREQPARRFAGDRLDLPFDFEFLAGL